MPKKQKPKKSGRVSFVSVSRLYNLGNYENCKYELSAEVAKGESPKETLLQLVQIARSLKPISVPSCMPSLKSARRKKLSERSEYEKSNYSVWLEAEREYKEACARRITAIELLDEMGGSSTHKDAKTTWDDDVPW